MPPIMSMRPAWPCAAFGLFYSPALVPQRQPRACVVSGPGASPDRVNLTVFADPIADIGNRGLKSVMTAKNVKFLTELPENPLPGEPFVYLPGFEAPPLEDDADHTDLDADSEADADADGEDQEPVARKPDKLSAKYHEALERFMGLPPMMAAIDHATENGITLEPAKDGRRVFLMFNPPEGSKVEIGAFGWDEEVNKFYLDAVRRRGARAEPVLKDINDSRPNRPGSIARIPAMMKVMIAAAGRNKVPAKLPAELDAAIKKALNPDRE